MTSYFSDATNSSLADERYRHDEVIDDPLSAATIVSEICGAIGILFFAGGIYRIIDNSKLLGWSLALITVLVLAEIVMNRLKLAFCGSLISLLFTVAVFGATLDATISLPTAALATVAASMIYLVRFNAPFVLTLIGFALAVVYIIVNGAIYNLAAIALVAACLLMVVETVQTYRRIPEFNVDRKIPARRATLQSTIKTQLSGSSLFHETLYR